MKNKKEFKSMIVQKVTDNPDFKKALIANPKTIIEKEIGKEANNLKIQVKLENANELIIVLPTEDLSDSDLENVSGAGFGDWF